MEKTFSIDVRQPLQTELILELKKRKFLSTTNSQMDENLRKSMVNEKIYNQKEPQFISIHRKFQKNPLDWFQNELPEFSRANGCFLGALLADVFGSITEFQSFRTEGLGVFQNISWNKNEEYIRIGLERKKYLVRPYGISTDDTSMARCIADTLIVNNFKLGQQELIDLRIRFLLWWNFGYNNGTQDHFSFGLGGNIAQSFDDFVLNNGKQPQATVGQTWGYNSGNGSIMRLAPIPIAFWRDEKVAQDMAFQSSLSTHNGQEAAECCRLLAFIVVRGIAQGNTRHKTIKEFLDQNLQEFKTDVKSVFQLANSQIEDKEMLEQLKLNPETQKFNKTINDRNWNWQNPVLNIATTRYDIHPDYYGSYAMDAMMIALHIVYHSKNLQETFIRCVDHGGDCDSFGSVAMQIAGAYYGMQSWMMELYFEQLNQNFGQYNMTPIAAYDEYNVFYLVDQLFHGLEPKIIVSPLNINTNSQR